MAESEIIRKLRIELNKEVTTEPQVVYILAEIRKLLEQQDLLHSSDYEYLVFHCDWALHSKLDRRMAKKVLADVDRTNVQILPDMKFEDLPEQIKIEFNKLANLELLREELERFFANNSLPSIKDNWNCFTHFYFKIIQDCPLLMTTNNPSINIRSVTVSVESIQMDFGKMTDGILEGTCMTYFVFWTLMDKNDEVRELAIMFSYN
jgi:hypothetical protein